MSSLPPGAYDLLITRGMSDEIQQLINRGFQVTQEPLDPAEASEPMARAIGALIARRLNSLGATGSADIARVAAEANRAIASISASESASEFLTGERLTAIGKPNSRASVAPIIPLSEHCLITGDRGERALGAQLQREIDSADEIDLLCSFIKWSGVQVLIDSLQRFCERPNAKLRVLTTTYIGATEPGAIDRLAQLPNCKVRISYETDGTRLHAKSWILRRRSNFGTCFVGSANMSNPALTDGMEWTLRISQSRERGLWDKLNASFQTTWLDASFHDYDPADQAQAVRLRESIARAKGWGAIRVDDSIPVYELHPKDYQLEVLDRLERERRYLNRSRQLVVAATGTGKTMIAAFDYRRYRENRANAVEGRVPRLLYLAHREEILRQALRSFRSVLRRGEFGCLVTGSSLGTDDESAFATIQSFTSRGLLAKHGPAHWDYVVLDEAHHADAATYREILTKLTPRILLGLTATPERSDGVDVSQYFENSVSAEIRLPDAIERRLLVPFHYFVARDEESVQLSRIGFNRGRYDQGALDAMLDGNFARALLVVQELQRRVIDVRGMRGIGFCAGTRHAKYMARIFSEDFKIPAIALTGEDSPSNRQTGISRLRDRDVNVIFTADLFNEGVDIPEVDTVLFLRPTESLTVFLQQLGRGLRRWDYKEALTVLDFVANADRRYRLDRKFRALLSRQSVDLAKECSDGFPTLPAGCAISLAREAQDQILESIRQYAQPNRQVIIDEIRRFETDHGRTPTLAEYLTAFDRDVIDIYRRGTWTSLRSEAIPGPITTATEPGWETHTASAMRRLCLLDDRSWIGCVERLVAAASTGSWEPRSAIDHLHAHMLARSIWPNETAPADHHELMLRLRSQPATCNEILSLMTVARDRISADPEVIDIGFDHALRLHAQYTSDQILTGLGMLTGSQRNNLREGIKFDAQRGIYLMFVTLNKSESDYSDSTRYEDYAISPTHFHWQTQNSAGPNLEGGLRVIDHRARGIRLLLFVRDRRKDRDITLPYMFLGEFNYESHEGSKPMSVIGRLSHPIPAALLRTALKAG